MQEEEPSSFAPLFTSFSSLFSVKLWQRYPVLPSSTVSSRESGVSVTNICSGLFNPDIARGRLETFKLANNGYIIMVIDRLERKLLTLHLLISSSFLKSKGQFYIH